MKAKELLKKTGGIFNRFCPVCEEGKHVSKFRYGGTLETQKVCKACHIRNRDAKEANKSFSTAFQLMDELVREKKA